MRMIYLWIALVMVSLATASPWKIDELKIAPKFEEVPERNVDGVKAVFYDGLVWKGKPTKIFAYLGIPKSEAGKKIPAMVLVHGGGGTAFVNWVKLWNSRGYAAIAMDTCGNTPDANFKPQPHEYGGPKGWGGFTQVDEPLEDQWTYHAVADVILAHSLIRSLPEIDVEKTGLTGISWGGYLTCITAGLDDRFRFAVPVYGCGFIGENSAWLDAFEKMGPERSKRWRENWDPSVYLPAAKMPMLWVTGTNDFAYPMDSLQKSYGLPTGDRFLAIRPRMPHGHGGAGENPEEIHVMANAILRDGIPLNRVTLGKRDGMKVSAKVSGKRKSVSAILNYTTDGGVWQKRLWKEVPAKLEGDEISAELPAGTTVYYFNVTDDNGVMASSPHEETD